MPLTRSVRQWVAWLGLLLALVGCLSWLLADGLLEDSGAASRVASDPLAHPDGQPPADAPLGPLPSQPGLVPTQGARAPLVQDVDASCRVVVVSGSPGPVSPVLSATLEAREDRDGAVVEGAARWGHPCELGAVSAGEYILQLSVGGLIVARRPVSVQGPETVVELALDDVPRLEARLGSGPGRGPSRGHVSVTGSSAVLGHGPIQVDAVTDDQGRVVVVGLPVEAVYSVRIQVEGHATAVLGPAVIPPDGRRLDLGVVWPAPERIRRVRVVGLADHGGHAAVWLSEGGPTASRVELTDGQDEAELVVPEASEVLVWADAGSGISAAPRALADSGADGVLSLPLVRGASVSGRVLTAGGPARSGLQVLGEQEHGGVRLVRSCWTDERGEFQLGPFFPAGEAVTVALPLHGVTDQAVLGGRAELWIEDPRPRSLSLQLIDARSGAPLVQPASLVLLHGDARTSYDMAPDAAGLALLQVAWPPGEAVLEISSPGYRPRRFPLSGDGSEGLPPNVALAPDEPTLVQVLGRTGEPIEGAFVKVSWPMEASPTGAPVAGAAFDAAEPGHLAVGDWTDAAGGVLVAPPHGTSARLTVVGRGYHALRESFAPGLPDALSVTLFPHEMESDHAHDLVGRDRPVPGPLRDDLDGLER